MKTASQTTVSPLMRTALCEAILRAATVTAPDIETGEDELLAACQRHARDEGFGYLGRRTVVDTLVAMGLSRHRGSAGTWQWRGIQLR